MYYTGPWVDRDCPVLPLSKENVMFSLSELRLIRQSLTLNEKSVIRLANKEGQPDGVVSEFRKTRDAIMACMRHVEQDYVEQEAAEKLKAAANVKK